MDNELNIDDLLNSLNSPEMTDTLKNFLGSSNHNFGLLDALKPYVNKKRQKKIDQCEKFVSMIDAISLINKFNGDEDGL